MKYGSMRVCTAGLKTTGDSIRYNEAVSPVSHHNPSVITQWRGLILCEKRSIPSVIVTSLLLYFMESAIILHDFMKSRFSFVSLSSKWKKKKSSNTQMRL